MANIVVAAALLCASLMAGAVGLDETSLVQKDALVHRQATTSCPCLTWSDAYHVFGAKCGYGHETDFVGLRGPTAAHVMGIEDTLCKNFFERLPDEQICVKAKYTTDDMVHHWCYVAPGCAAAQNKTHHSALQGIKELFRDGPPVPGTAMTEAQVTALAEAGEAADTWPGPQPKWCAEGDKHLKDMKLEELVSWAEKNGLSKATTVKMAYNTVPADKLHDGHSILMKDIQSFWGLAPGKAAEPMTDDLRKFLQEVKDSGKPTVFDSSKSGAPPFAVAEGSKLYEITKTPVADLDFMLRMKGDHQAAAHHVACVAGCDKAPGLVPAAVDAALGVLRGHRA